MVSDPHELEAITTILFNPGCKVADEMIWLFVNWNGILLSFNFTIISWLDEILEMFACKE